MSLEPRLTQSRAMHRDVSLEPRLTQSRAMQCALGEGGRTGNPDLRLERYLRRVDRSAEDQEACERDDGG